MPGADASRNGLQEDLVTMRSAAVEAGRIALGHVLGGSTPKSWEKKSGSPVTEADLAVNEALKSRLEAARPDYGWLSEESADREGARARDRTWVVDPIDGTRAYMRGGDDWCIGMAVVEDGRAAASVIFAPARGELYEAVRGGGAFLNGQRMRVSDRGQERGARMIASQAMLSHEDWPVAWPPMEVADPKPNATLLRLALVASGAWDAVIVLYRKFDWDLAAGALLVEEAGGVASTHLGEAFCFNRTAPGQRSLIAAGKALHPLLVARVKGVRLVDPNEARKSDMTKPSEKPMKQLLHLVLGGELSDVQGVEFEDLGKIDFVGAFASYPEAYDAWKSAAQRTVDHAEMRYFILHAHKLLDPETGDQHAV